MFDMEKAASLLLVLYLEVFWRAALPTQIWPWGLWFWRLV
jgi:hypothetical protein